MKKIIAVAAVIVAIATPVLAQERHRQGHDTRQEHARDGRGERVACSTRPAAEWLSADQITQKLKEQDLAVTKIEAKAGCYEVGVTDAKGVRIELYVDAVTAEILSRRERNRS